MQRKKEHIVVIGANEHNLKNIDIDIPRNKLVVITGISGSGKSSLAFDTIYAEGQRRYMETFSNYARQFMGHLERPDVEKIEGLSPVISIEQKTAGWNPRSTVGTITEVYDFLRLLYARIGEAYSHVTGNKMIKYTEEQVLELILKKFDNQKIMILAPVIRGRKGHYRELFEYYRKQGYTKVRVNGEMMDLVPKMQLDRYKTHNIELIIDRIKVGSSKQDRLSRSLETAFKMGNDFIFIWDEISKSLTPYSKQLMDPESGISYEAPSPNAFSFNSPYGACPQCKGMGQINEVDLNKVMPNMNNSINQMGILPFGEVRENSMFKQLRAISKKYAFSFATPIKDIPEEALNIILYGNPNEKSSRSHGFEYHDNLSREGLTNMLKRWYEETTSEKIRTWAEDFMTVIKCPECDGYRIKKTSLHFKIKGKHIGILAEMNLSELLEWSEDIEAQLEGKYRLIAHEIIKEFRKRLGFLIHVGLEYLNLNRPGRTLSGGESQRTRLATQIGSQLTGITYILDEPSIGLHQRDNQKLIASLKNLVDIGNTVIVVEHDKDIMLASDYLVDLGPGAGISGGDVVGKGLPMEFDKISSLTADYLNGKRQIEIPKKRRRSNGKKLVLQGASGNNLKNISLTLALGIFNCVTGVSGSGKSSLINQTLYPIIRKHFYKSLQRPLAYEHIEGLDNIDKIIEINQSPIGRTPRSNPATYTKVFGHIRNIYAQIPEAKIRGYKAGRFSFNVKGGRCEICRGGGKRVIEMNFLPDVLVDCETCLGRRYNRETLEILFKGKSINDVLDMTVDEATSFFEAIPSIYRKLKTLQDVGLGYITLGQQATTLSGGEAQRVKLSEELSKRDTGQTLYILDEPTTGLHFEDIKHLIAVLQKLVDKGNTLLVIEHNMDIIKCADHIIDLGPEGGHAGGDIIFAGTPEALAKSGKGHTAPFLKTELMG